MAPTPVWEFEKFVGVLSGVQLIYGMNGRRMDESQPELTDEVCIELWRDYVESSIAREVENLVQTIEFLEVTVSNETQEVLIDSQRVAYVFDTTVELRSPISEHNLNRFVAGAFNTEEERLTMVEYLRNTTCPQFAYITTADLVMPPNKALLPEDGSDESSGAGLIAGLAIATVAAVILTSLFLFLRHKKKNNPSVAEEEEVIFPIPEHPTSHNPDEYASEIDVEGGTDISTLGDPMPQAMYPMLSGDMSTTDSATMEYDFDKAYHSPPSVSDASETASRFDTLQSSNPVLSNDGIVNTRNEFETVIAVLAPAGRLGLILESSKDGTPIVNSVNPGSALEDEVEPGDRLLSVDGLDVTVLLASEVSKLIAEKRDEDVRNLVFARSMARPNNLVDG
jgi:hypothetical protein